MTSQDFSYLYQSLGATAESHPTDLSRQGSGLQGELYIHYTTRAPNHSLYMIWFLKYSLHFESDFKKEQKIFL